MHGVEIRNRRIGAAFGELLDGEMETRKWAGRGNGKKTSS